jgi:hypothetical protein
VVKAVVAVFEKDWTDAAGTRAESVPADPDLEFEASAATA